MHEAFPTFPSDWSALAVATDTTEKPTCGVDPGTGLNACGEAYILIAGTSIVVASKVISVSPLDSTNPAGTSHTVTANVHAVGGTPPVVGQLVNFTVTGLNAGATGTCVPADCKSNASGDVAFTYTDTGGVGSDTIKASFTDDAGSLQTATAQKHWVEGTTHSTSTTYTGASSVQYSDAAALSGTLLDTSGVPVGVSGKQLDFTLGLQSASAGPTDVSGNASTSLTVNQKPGTVSTVGTSFAGDGSYAASNDSDPFAITKEDCTLAYTGDTLVNAANLTNLKAQFGELDSSPGDWSGKSVSFAVTDASNVTQTFTATTNATGEAATTVALGPNVYGVNVSFAGDDYYNSCRTAADTLVTVEGCEREDHGRWLDRTIGRAHVLRLQCDPGRGRSPRSATDPFQGGQEQLPRPNGAHADDQREHGDLDGHGKLEPRERLHVHGECRRQRLQREEGRRHDLDRDQTGRHDSVHDERAAAAQGRQHHGSLSSCLEIVRGRYRGDEL